MPPKKNKDTEEELEDSPSGNPQEGGGGNPNEGGGDPGNPQEGEGGNPDEKGGDPSGTPTESDGQPKDEDPKPSGGSQDNGDADKKEGDSKEGAGDPSVKEIANGVIDVTEKAANAFNKLSATVTLEKVTADVAGVNEAASSWEKVSFDKIIGEPLKAAVKAQGDAAKSVLEFIRNVGVTNESNNGSETMTVVSFNFFQNGKIAKMQIPLITLVPIPTLGIKEVTYDFKMTISSASDVTMTNTNSFSTIFNANDPQPALAGNPGENKDGEKGKQEAAKKEADASKVKDATKKSVTFSAGYSSKKDSSATQTSKYSVETTMDVTLKVEKDDLPAGVSKMLEILNGSTEIVDPNGELTLSADNLTLSSDGYAILSVSYMDGNGNFDPSAITCTDVDGKKEQGKKVASADSLQILFTESGVYKVSAGKKSHLVQISPAAKATDS